MARRYLGLEANQIHQTVASDGTRARAGSRVMSGHSRWTAVAAMRRSPRVANRIQAVGLQHDIGREVGGDDPPDASSARAHREKPPSSRSPPPGSLARPHEHERRHEIGPRHAQPSRTTPSRAARTPPGSHSIPDQACESVTATRVTGSASARCAAPLLAQVLQELRQTPFVQVDDHANRSVNGFSSGFSSPSASRRPPGRSTRFRTSATPSPPPRCSRIPPYRHRSPHEIRPARRDSHAPSTSESSPAFPHVIVKRNMLSFNPNLFFVNDDGFIVRSGMQEAGSGVRSTWEVV